MDAGRFFPGSKAHRFAYFEGAGTPAWLAPSGVVQVFVTMSAAGGGGGAGTGGVAQAAGGGGGGGESVIRKALTVVPGTSYTITLGTGGTAGVSGGAAPGAGGNTTFGALLTLVGGGAAQNSAAGPTHGNGGTGGGPGGIPGSRGTTSVPGNGGGTILAPVETFSFNRWTATAAVGIAGTWWGCGGSGSSGGANNGGAGADGFCVVEWFEDAS